MSKTMPSLLALLGLVAVAGYQNRDKISEMIEAGRQKRPVPAGPGEESDVGYGAAPVGASLSTALSELIDRFKSSGFSESADSWVSKGPNQPLQTTDLEQALGEDTLAELESKTGISRAELVARLTAVLPETVDRLTPEGRLPTGSAGAGI